MLVNDGHWPATCLSLFDCQKEPAIGFHQGLKPLCSSPYYLTSKAVNSMIKCAYKIRGLNISSIWKFLPFSLSVSFSLFIFLLVKYIQMTFTGPRGWICCHGEKSELLSPVVWVSNSTTWIWAALPVKLLDLSCIFYQLLAVLLKGLMLSQWYLGFTDRIKRLL